MGKIKPATSYQEDFDTEVYYRQYRPENISRGKDTEGIERWLKFILDSLHELFDTGSVSGERLLDVGTGASLLSVLSASRHVKKIHLSDLLPRHLDLLQRWMDGEDRENNIMEYVLWLEKNGVTVVERVADIRRKVKRIMHLDVTQKVRLKDIEGPYDIITSSFCFESAAKSATEYSEVVTNIGKLVKPGGYMVFAGTLEEAYYIVGGHTFWNANTTGDDVKSAINSAGFSICFWKEMDYPIAMKELASFKSVFVTAAQKMTQLS